MLCSGVGLDFHGGHALQINPALKLSVPCLWDLLGDIRLQVAAHLEAADPEAREAAVMAASELIENVIKYGRAATDAPPALLELECTDVIRLSITSSIRSPQAAQEAIDRIEVIRRAPDRLALYETRMTELMALPFNGGSSHLGLLRVAGEGKFELEGRLVGEMLQIVATRRLT